jgi:hypothetical protein
MKFNWCCVRWPVLMLLLSVAFPALGGDVSIYAVVKSREYGQHDESAPTLNSGLPFEADAIVIPTGTTSVTRSTVRFPNGTTRNMPWNADSEDFEYDTESATKPPMDSAWPTGRYRLTVNTVHDGTKTLNLDLPADAYPNPPRVANYGDAQAIYATTDFALTWDAFQGGTSGDWIEVVIDDGDSTVFSTPMYMASGFLDGTATSVVIPAATLSPGKSYEASLRFYKITTADLSSYPGATGLVFYQTSTDFSLATKPNTAVPDVRHYGTYKGRRFLQTSPDEPALLSNNAYYWSAIVDPQTPDAVSGSAVQTPKGAFKIPVWTSLTEMYAYSEYFTQQADLDAVYPSGNYTFLLNTVHDGSKSLILNLTGDAYPAPLRITSFDEIKTVDARQNFVLHWAPVTGASAKDHIRVFLVDQQQNPVFGTLHGDFLPASSSSISIPANTLAPGANYYLSLWYFHDVYEGHEYPGVVGTASYVSVTQTVLTTVSNAPKFESITWGPNAAPIMKVRGQSGQAYRVEASEDLIHWTVVTTLTAPADTFEVTDNEASHYRSRYYQIIAP